MSRMEASLVVKLIDGVSGPARGARRSLSALEKAERNVVMARRGQRLSRQDRAEERLIAVREKERARKIAMFGRVAGATVLASGYAAGRAYLGFAELERRVNRIVLNADKGAEAIRPTLTFLQDVAKATKMSFGDIVDGLDTLIASGRTLEESLAFLPAVATTAQASGAAISDIALSADAMSGSLKISAEDMQNAFDILVAGGKAGKFELKDMAQYLPSLLPAWAALGYEGEAGLQKIVAMLQIVRNQTGDSSEAATNLSNVLQKMYSDTTANKFKKVGVDLRAELDAARKAGKDVIEVFLDITEKVIDGDLSKITQLFPDAQMQKGVRALITQREELEKLNGELKNVDGSTMRDFGQIIGDTQARIDSMKASWDALMTSFGASVADSVNPLLDALSAVATKVDGIKAGVRRATKDGQTQDEINSEYARRHDEMYGKPFWPNEIWRRKTRREEDLAKFGSGEYSSPYQRFDDMLALADRRGPPRRWARGRRPAEIPIPTPRPGDTYPIPTGRPGVSVPPPPFALGRGSVPSVPMRPYPAGASPRDAERDSMKALRSNPNEIADVIEDALSSGGDDAGSKIADGGRLAGAEVAKSAREIESAIDRAFSRGAAKITAAVSNIRINMPAGGGTGARIRQQSDGLNADGGAE